MTHVPRLTQTGNVVLSPVSTMSAWRVAFLGGVHGNEWSSLLAPAQIVRALIFQRTYLSMVGAPRDRPDAMATAEVLVIREAHPAACALGMREDADGGDLNWSWPGTPPTGVPGRPSAGQQSAQSLARAAAVAAELLAFAADVVIGLHDEPGPWRAYVTSNEHAHVAAEIGLAVSAHDHGLGLPWWAQRNGIVGADLEAPSRDQTAATPAIHALRAMELACALAR